MLNLDETSLSKQLLIEITRFSFKFEQNLKKKSVKDLLYLLYPNTYNGLGKCLLTLFLKNV